MSRNKAAAFLEHIRGETITFGLRSTDPAFDGTEVVTCKIKVAENDVYVPADSVPDVASATPAFVAALGEVAAAWHFTIDASETALLQPDVYITDVRIEHVDGTVTYPAPLGITLVERVTA